MSNLLLLGAGGPTSAAFEATAVEFTASTDRLSNTSFAFGSPDLKKGTVSIWFKHVGSIPHNWAFFDVRSSGGVSQFYAVTYQTIIPNSISAFVSNSILAQNTGTNSISADTWNWFAMSWDSSVPVSKMALNGSAVTVVTPPVTNNEITSPAWLYLPANSSPANDVHMAEVYIAVGQYIDLSVQANREKFRSAAGKPVSLGSDGSLPTGTAPQAYFRFLNPASSPQPNSTGGSSLNVTGTLASATPP